MTRDEVHDLIMSFLTPPVAQKRPETVAESP